ncbi:MAG: bifunctional (p)ppGpp synthetase/guanosine-3',5'-bis(diphosphate) 3'-pyrophosphohydrolase [Candidatus Cloacimonetes bacterium]|nr:bifunctional (p)ppGpp synthetase/guanosine-3',5'-bis(diphosphate) 3'-pyrophosphohydrolase [Candidatus Cloacimonadota bacterium]
MKYTEITENNFLNEITKVNKQINLEFIKKVFDFTRVAHIDQKRKSGEPYIIHPLNVAYILASINMDLETVSAGLLHDIIEDTGTPFTMLEEKFGFTIANLVEGVTKIDKYKYQASKTRLERQAENFRKLLISVTKDIRVILIKLADRLHNMRTLQYMSQSEIQRIARETLDIYAPLANRFGIAKFKWELEDLSLKYLQPEEYKKIVNTISEKRDQRDNYIQKIIKPLKKKLFENSIEAKIYGRSKHFYSIYRKHLMRKANYYELYDLAAIRIIVQTIEQCYSVLGFVHVMYEPIGRFRDYIARPKPNGYQSLHTIVIGLNQRQIEIQIRTEMMHQIAEEGIASHWRYKETGDKNFQNETQKIDLQSSFELQLKWIRQFLQQQNVNDSTEFIEELKLDLYPEIIIAQTPKGDFLKLPKGATAVDFAFAIHSDVGLRTIGTRVNEKLVPLKTELISGDVVDILTSKHINAGKDWMKFLVTHRARQKVRSYFHKKEIEDAIMLGEEIFIKRFRKTKYKLKNKPELLKLINQFKINDERSFLAKVGKGEILVSDIKNAIENLEEDFLEVAEIEKEEKTEIELADGARSKTRGIKIGNIDSLMLNYAKCCNPVPGDDVIGYTTRGRGITIHRKNCTNPGFIHLQKTEPERIIEVDWKYAEENNPLILIKLDIIGTKRIGFLSEILEKFKSMKINIEHTNMRSVKNLSIGNFKFYIKNIAEMDKVNLELLTINDIMNCAWEICSKSS